MKKILNSVIACAVLSSLSSIALNVQSLEVDRAGSWFVGPLFGEYDSDSSRNLNDAMTGGLQAGYNFNNLFGAEVAANYFQPDDKTTNQGQHAYFAHVDGLFDLPTHTRITPYAAVGVGVLHITTTRFVPDYGFGVEVFPASNFSFSGNFRHIMQWNPQENDNLFYGAINFYFGNGDVVQAMPMPTPVANQEAAAKKFREESRYVLPDGFPPCQTPGEVGCIRLNGNQMTMNLDVKYANDKAEILSSYQPQLDSLGKFLKAYPQINLTINGYTSNTGTYAHNQVLSNHRAESVKHYLVSHCGINANRMSTKGWSWNNPVASNKTAEGQALNRRVEAVATVPLKPTVTKVEVTD